MSNLERSPTGDRFMEHWVKCIHRGRGSKSYPPGLLSLPIRRDLGSCVLLWWPCSQVVIFEYFIKELCYRTHRVGQEEENGGWEEQYGTILTIQLAIWVVGLLAMWVEINRDVTKNPPLSSILLLCLVLRSLYSLEVQMVRLVNLVDAEEDKNDFIEDTKEEKQPSPVWFAIQLLYSFPLVEN